jgi:ParB family chromosome partitioning protein
MVGRIIKGATNRKKRNDVDRDVLRLQEDLSEKLGTAVTIQSGTRHGRGKLIIAYNTLDQLDAIIARLKR